MRTTESDAGRRAPSPRVARLFEALAPGAEGPIARGEWALVGLLCAVCLAFWVAHFKYFFVPMSDYVSFERAARAIWHLQPYDLKRMPTFPFLMGLVALLLPGRWAYLHAALGLNIAFGVGQIVLLFLVARRMIGWLACVPLFLAVTHKIFQTWTLQPLGEPSMGFFLLLAVYFFQRRSPWQYFAAFWVMFTRYDLMPLLPLLLLVNWFTDRPPAEEGADGVRRRRRRHLLFTAAVGFFILIWAGLIIYKAMRQQSVPYQSWVVSGRSQPAYWLWALARPFHLRVSAVGKMDWTRWGAGPSWALCVGLLALGFAAALVGPVGRWAGMARLRRTSLLLVPLLFAYVFIHYQFGVTVERYSYPVLWIFYVYATIGAAVVLRAFRAPAAWLWRPFTGYVAAAALMALAAWRAGPAFGELMGVESVRPTATYVLFGGAVAALFVAYAMRRGWEAPWAGLPCAAALLALFGPQMLRDTASHADTLFHRKHKLHEQKLMGEWLRDHLRDGEKVATIQEGVLEHYGDLRREQTVRMSHMAATTYDELVAEMRQKEIRYLVYIPRTGLYIPYEEEDGKYIKYKIYLLRPFYDGREPPDFRRVYTTPLPAESPYRPGHIFELLPAPVSPEEQAERDRLRPPPPPRPPESEWKARQRQIGEEEDEGSE